ncbi:hypothetical protein AYK24_00560 [Thermoplasmatales archaeon SG8-52-4]|nr:MAG: hypothetical protein AYK24_00560 [Thermoplasmatales archaeon SG8-52-4]
MDVETLKKLFVHRKDIYAIQKPDGRYLPSNSPISDVALDAHLKGKQTLGIYHLDKQDTVTFSCIDIDINKDVWSKKDYKFDDWKDLIYKQISIIKNKLAKYGITGYAEISGMKGAHVWYFFKEPIPAGTARDINSVMLSSVGVVDPNLHLEFFPKQDTLGDGGYGNLIKLPCGMHQLSKTFSYFLDDVLKGVEYVDSEKIRKVVSPIDAIFLNCAVMADIKKQAPLGHLNHAQRLTLGYILLNVPGGEDELRKLMKLQDDYDEGKTNYYIGKLKQRHYKAINCRTLQTPSMNNMCPGPCANIRGGKNPTVFFHRHAGGMTTGASLNTVLDYKSRIEIYEKQGTEFLYKPDGKDQYRLLSSFIIDITDTIIHDDGETVKTTSKGQLVKGDESYPFEISSKDLGNPDKLRSEIYNVAGNEGIFVENYNHFINAINKFTKANTTLIKESFGYDGPEHDPHRRYISPSVVIDAKSVRNNSEIIVDLSNRGSAQWLDLTMLDAQAEKDLIKHINDDLLNLTDFGITHALLGHTFSPIIEPWLYQNDRTRYILFIRGSSGEGKSFIAQTMQHFYGPHFGRYESWAATTNSLETAGFNYKDTIFLIDDWKRGNIKDHRGALGILQSYADRSARTRLTKEAELKQAKPMRGTLLITGEDLAEGQSSVMARTITLDYSQPQKNIAAGLRVLDNRKYYSAITAKYIHHVLQYPNKETVYHDFQRKAHEEFYKYTIGKHNDIRIARNMSLLYTSYYFFAEWFWPSAEAKTNQDKFKQYLIDQVDNLIRLTAIQRPAEKFWFTMRDLLAIGKLRLQTSKDVDLDKTIKMIPIIGYHGSGGEDYLIMDTALREVEKYLRGAGESLEFSKITIIEDLHKAKYIKSPSPVKKVFNNQNMFVYPVDKDKLLK